MSAMMPGEAMMHLAVDGITALFSARSKYNDRCARKTLVNKTTLQSGDVRSRYVRGKVDQDYEVDYNHVLGKGCSGSVVSARCRSSGMQVAVKTYAKNTITQSQLDRLRSEVNIYLTMDHAHIATLLAIYENNDYVTLVMELCAGKELHERLCKKGSFSEEEARLAAREMCIAISHLHELGVVHRDLKLENWLYAHEGEYAPLKLIDFGFSLKWDQKQMMDRCLGSTNYMAPEVFYECYSEKCDMWSIGVIVYSLLVSSHPFRGADKSELEASIKCGEWSFPQNKLEAISEHAQDFVRGLLKLDSQTRMSAQQCLEHPWLQGEEVPPQPILRRTRSAMAQ